MRPAGAWRGACTYTPVHGCARQCMAEERGGVAGSAEGRAQRRRRLAEQASPTGTPERDHKGTRDPVTIRTRPGPGFGGPT